MIKVLTFDEVLHALSSVKAKHLLLGNGFSRALRNDVFAYDALFQQAKGSMSGELLAAFGVLDTTDFETVMRALRSAAELAKVYAKDGGRAGATMRRDAEQLREVLARTIAGNHPNRPSEIEAAQYGSCKRFLGNFKDIYTLNYDLLLYWTLMQSEVEPQVRCDDGFRQPDDGPVEYVTWEVDKTDSQNIHYLHGALHIFDAGHEIQKFTWSNTQVALIDQIRSALAADKFPLFVSEGSSDEKESRIQHSGLLNRAYRSFAKIQHALIVYGHSMSEKDEHILRLLDRGKTSHIAVSVHGDPASPSSKKTIARAVQVAERCAKYKTEILFFDAASARVWDAPPPSDGK